MSTENLVIELSRENSSVPWGFRLQGGIDFTTPLSIQLVNPGSVAERCGLKAGDAVLTINNKNSDELEHEAAKREILMSGNRAVLKVQRGAVKIWKPKVTPMSQLRPDELNKMPEGDPYIQRTSLAADKQESLHIGSTHNRAARPFPGFGGGSSLSGGSSPQPQPTYQPPPPQPQQAFQHTPQAPPSYQQPQQEPAKVLTHNTYNSPMGLYSNQNITDTFSQQSQLLTGGMAGLKLIEKDDVSTHDTVTAVPARIEPPSSLTERGPSPTFRAVHDTSPSPARISAPYMEQKENEEIKYQGFSDPFKQSRSFRMLEEELNATEGGSAPPAQETVKPTGIRSVKAPTAKPPGQGKPQQAHMTCKGCDMLVTGVFVKIKGDPYHPECFKCTACGKNLKQQGYFEINGRLYCETHARQMAQPPGEDMVSVPVYR